MALDLAPHGEQGRQLRHGRGRRPWRRSRKIPDGNYVANCESKERRANQLGHGSGINLQFKMGIGKCNIPAFRTKRG
jgi:hypothetical protein